MRRSRTMSGVRSSRVKFKTLPERTPSLWFWGFLMIAIGGGGCLCPRQQERERVKRWSGTIRCVAWDPDPKSVAYLAVPSLVVSRAKTPPRRRCGRAKSWGDRRRWRSIIRPIPIKPVSPSSHGKRIVIDPGHGGKQHGAISESGVSEKDITLDIAPRLRRLIVNTPKFS